MIYSEMELIKKIEEMVKSPETEVVEFKEAQNIETQETCRS